MEFNGENLLFEPSTWENSNYTSVMHDYVYFPQEIVNLSGKTKLIPGREGINKYTYQVGSGKKNIDYTMKHNHVQIIKQDYVNGNLFVNNAIRKAENSVECMVANEDIRIQVQAVARIINQLDIIRKSNCINANKRKILAFFRSVLKLNSDRELFTSEQLKELKTTLTIIKNDNSDEMNSIADVEKRLRKVGLRTMVAWE